MFWNQLLLAIFGMIRYRWTLHLGITSLCWRTTCVIIDMLLCTIHVICIQDGQWWLTFTVKDDSRGISHRKPEWQKMRWFKTLFNMFMRMLCLRIHVLGIEPSRFAYMNLHDYMDIIWTHYLTYKWHQYLHMVDLSHLGTERGGNAHMYIENMLVLYVYMYSVHRCDNLSADMFFFYFELIFYHQKIKSSVGLAGSSHGRTTSGKHCFHEQGTWSTLSITGWFQERTRQEKIS